MVRNELNAPKLAWLSDAERWESLIDIWTEVKMLTGAIVYEDANLRSIQMTMLETFIMTHPKLSQLTKNEIRHAFYLNAQWEFADQVPASTAGMFRHYNKELNAEFIGDVLSAYVRKKSKIYSQKGDGILHAMLLPTTVTIPKTSDEEWMHMIQEDYDLFRQGMTERIFNTSSKYLVLRRLQLIFFSSRAKWKQWYHYALRERERLIRATPPKNFSERIAQQQAISLYDAIKKTGLIQISEHKSVLHEMRRAVYLKFFEIIMSCAINKIFTEIEFKHES